MKKYIKYQPTEDFELFAKLAPLIPESCHDEVKSLMNLLDNEWRDKLCEDTYYYVTTGRKKYNRKSLLMQRMYNKVLRVIENNKK